MFKSRAKQAEKEAKQDPNYRPTSELEPIAEEGTEVEKYHFPVAGIIVISVLFILVIVCLIVILVYQKK